MARRSARPSTISEDRDQAYRTYLIKKGLRDRQFHISKDGFHIATVETIGHAKTTIDLLID